MKHERQDLLALLMPFARTLRRLEESAAAGHGLTMWRYAILNVVEHEPGQNQAEIADRLGYSKNRIIADLDRLEDAGLIRRERASDRRANVLYVTDVGRTTMRAVQSEIHRGEDELLATISPTAQRSFVGTLRALRKSGSGAAPRPTV